MLNRKFPVKRIGMTVAICSVIWVATTYESPTARFTSDGSCISFERGTVSFRDLGAGSPIFIVPSGIPSSNVLDAASRTGLSVRYRKQRDGAYTRRAARRLSPPVGACAETPAPHGLAQLLPAAEPQAPTTALTCVVGNRPNPPNTRYVAEQADGPFPAVLVTCATSDQVANCSVTNLMPNDWEATITLPKTDFADWQRAVIEAATFFDENLTDCGPQE